MAPPRKYSIKELSKYFNLSEKEIEKDWAKYRKAYQRRHKPHTFRQLSIALVQCQKPKCEDVSRRIIELKDGSRIRYCDYHYDDWFSEYPSET